MIKIVLDGISLELEETAASLVQRIVGDAKKSATDAATRAETAETRATKAEAALATATDAATKATETAAKELKAAKDQIPTPAQLEALGEERTGVCASAKAIVGDAFTDKGKGVHAIRLEALGHVIANDAALKPVVEAVLGGVELAKAEPASIATAFKAVVASRAASAKATGDGETAARDEATARAFAGADSKGNGGGDAGITVIDGTPGAFMANVKRGFKAESAAESE